MMRALRRRPSPLSTLLVWKRQRVSAVQRVFATTHPVLKRYYANARVSSPQQTRIFSGIQPTGQLHIGNYLGAISNWVALQEKYSSIIYCIVDLHSLTTSINGDALKNSTFEMAVNLLACGIDPQKAILYVQSSIPAHTELMWIIGCMTPLGLLSRMTQFKDKKASQQTPLVGLLSYPVLMAADILAFKATHVPVGEDQLQHLEFTRNLADTLNSKVFKSQEYFPSPQPLLVEGTQRVMSLRDGTKKMSKSDISEKSRIHLTDDADAIRLKIQKAKTDSIESISYEPDTRPEVANLMEILAKFSDRSITQVAHEMQGKNSATLKAAVAEVLVEKVGAIGEEIKRLRGEREYVERVLAEGAQKARAICDPIVKEIKDALGLR